MYRILKAWDPFSSLLSCRQDSRLLPALKIIAHLSDIDVSYNENIKQAQRALRAKGLRVDNDDYDAMGSRTDTSPWMQVAHHIKDTYLEPEKRQHPLPLRLVLDHQPDGRLQLDVMPRTSLSFFILAHHLKFTIIVFSSRARPCIYDPPCSRGVIAFFHAIDSPERVSRFDVLQFQMDKVAKWFHAAPAPQHPFDRPDLSTPALATASDVPLPSPTAQTTQESSVEPIINITTSDNAQQDHPSAADGFIPFASYRHERRIQVHRAHQMITTEARDASKEDFHIAW